MRKPSDIPRLWDDVKIVIMDFDEGQLGPISIARAE